ncbi:hypothetical protein C7M84_009285 [Penaeus vannamei]|uniref:Uncharacterized protein n=1 Tax=Penaeus vannamei TaxID=6689 RepID=A0A3R7M596_PENVA|nr:hypothetical protein C7M84_009285 [Penaeus vannamei]
MCLFVFSSAICAVSRRCASPHRIPAPFSRLRYSPIPVQSPLPATSPLHFTLTSVTPFPHRTYCPRTPFRSSLWHAYSLSNIKFYCSVFLFILSFISSAPFFTPPNSHTPLPSTHVTPSVLSALPLTFHSLVLSHYPFLPFPHFTYSLLIIRLSLLFTGLFLPPLLSSYFLHHHPLYPLHLVVYSTSSLTLPASPFHFSTALHNSPSLHYATPRTSLSLTHALPHTPSPLTYSLAPLPHSPTPSVRIFRSPPPPPPPFDASHADSPIPPSPSHLHTYTPSSVSSLPPPTATPSPSSLSLPPLPHSTAPLATSSPPHYPHSTTPSHLHPSSHSTSSSHLHPSSHSTSPSHSTPPPLHQSLPSTSHYPPPLSPGPTRSQLSDI